MGKKYYIHLRPRLDEINYTMVCSICGKPTDIDGRSEAPCSISCAVPFDEDVELHINGVRAKILYKKQDLLKIVDQEDHAKLSELIAKATLKTAYGIGPKGIIPPTDELVEFIEQIIVPKYNLNKEANHEAVGY